MSARWAAKDPDEYSPHKINWTAEIPGDPIASSTWMIPDGITGDRSSKSDYEVIIWLRGGAVGQRYEILNRIVTTSGAIFDQTMILPIASK